MLRPSLLILLLVAGCAPIQRLVSRGDESDRLAAGVTIVRDEWGVPHIFGETDAHAAFGAGYVQAEDGFALLEDTYLLALGRAAHWYGDRHLASDLLVSAFEIERLAREEYEREPAARREVWDAFAAGINYWLRTSGERPRLITRFESWMPFALVRTPNSRRVIDGLPLDTILLFAGVERPTASATPTGAQLPTAFAVGPSRASAGHAVLLHVGRGGFFDATADYELMLASGSGWQARGFARLGLPLPHAGHNGAIAWAQTPTLEDVADVYAVAFDDADPLAYNAHGVRQTAREWLDTLAVNSTAGVRPLIVTLRSTRHGPLITRGDTALAVRIAGMEEGGLLQQLYALSRAAGLEQFRAALDATPASSNTVYADTAGNIMVVYGGAVPARDAAIDWTRPVDASSPRTQWNGYLALDELPQITNPADAVVSAPYPPERDAARRLIAVDSEWTLEAWSRLAFDAQLADTDAAIGVLASEWERIGGVDAARARRLDAVVDLLRSWDEVASVDSEEATLYVLWQERLREAGYVDEYARFRAMEDVVTRLAQENEDGSVPWGEVNRLQRMDSRQRFSDDRVSLPVAGAPWWTGVVFDFTAEAGPGPLRRYGVSGITSVLAVELAPTVVSRSVVTFGQSSDSASAHWFDQAALYVRGELKPGPLEEAAVRSGARRVYHPGERPAPVRELP